MALAPLPYICRCQISYMFYAYYETLYFVSVLFCRGNSMYVNFPQPPVISFGYSFASCVVLKLLISRDLIYPEYLTVELQG